MRSFASSAAMLRATFGFAGVRPMVEDGITAAGLEDDPASPWYSYARALLGFGLHLTGNPDAMPMLERALAAGVSRPRTRMVALSVAAVRAADEGELTRAQQMAEEAARIVNGRGLIGRPPSSFILTALGAVHSRQGRLEEARAEFEYAIYRRRRWVLLTPWPSVESQLRLAHVLVAMDDRPAAATVLAEVRNVLTALPDGADALLARLVALERGLTVPPPPLAEPLTEREQAVLSLLRKSMSVSEIARELYLSGNTVKTHRRAIYRKLGVRTREEAIERTPEREPGSKARRKSRLSCLARRTASRRSDAPSLRKMLFRCVFTVWTEMNISAAMPSVSSISPTCRSTSRSRLLSCSTTTGVARSGASRCAGTAAGVTRPRPSS